MDLQTFDKVLLKAQKTGRVTIEKNMITDIQSATFEIKNIVLWYIINYSDNALQLFLKSKKQNSNFHSE